MPDFGTTRLTGEIGAIFDDIRKKIDEAKMSIAGAATELVEEVRGYDDVARALRAERDTVRKHIDSLLGNRPPVDVRPMNQNGDVK